MNLTKRNGHTPKQKFSFFDFFINLVGALQIIAILLSGFIIGLTWAIRTWRKKGTAHFMSETMASADAGELNGNKDGAG